MLFKLYCGEWNIMSLCYTKHAVCIETGAYVRLNFRNTNSADSYKLVQL